MDKYVVAVVGPTAIGKTRLAIALAKHYNTEIISADSRQFYKEMSIGTAVPSREELASAPHHFIQHISINDSYSVGHFEQEALEKLQLLFQHKNIVVLVGGSGLYVDAVFKGLHDFPDIPLKVRDQLQRDLNDQGLPALVEELQLRDPVTSQRIDVQNTQRVLRALEVCRATGKPYATFVDAKKPQRPFNAIKIGLEAERELVYERINKRVDLMMEEGLEDEVRQLIPQKDLNALNTVGYKELFAYFEGKTDRETAIAEIKKNTRRFAKRQLTWYRRDKKIEWFDINYKLRNIIETIDTYLG